MKKQNLFYTLLFCMMAMVVSFASCSDDDDNENSPFVGSWVDSEHEGDSYVFNSDGTWGLYFDQTWDSVHEKGYYKGTYRYDASSKLLYLTITALSDDEDQDDLPWTEIYKVTSVSSNSITLVDPEDPEYVLTLVRKQ